MKSLKGLIPAIIALVFLGGCETTDNEPDLPDPYLDSYADVEECLSFSLLKDSQPGPNQSCVSFSYDGDSLLSIIHYNSAFNCCPEKVLTTFELRNDTILITEDDSLQLCRCNCLFNVDMKIHNLPPSEYVMIIREPYVDQEDQIFVIDLDLENMRAGQVCKYRDFYPWHEL